MSVRYTIIASVSCVQIYYMMAAIALFNPKDVDLINRRVKVYHLFY
jgi:hypothetical protein